MNNLRSNKYLWNICVEIYTQMYKEAIPPMEWKVIERLAKENKLQENWFNDFYLPQKRQLEIVEQAYKKYKCGTYEKRKINFEVWLGCSPSMSKK
jgi:hypothetical protein